MPKHARDTSVTALEQKLWKIADKLRGTTEPSRYREPVLGLVFLKFISETRDAPDAPVTVPDDATWNTVRMALGQRDIDQVIDACMQAIERHNSELVGALPANFTDGPLAAERLTGLVELVDSIRFSDDNGNGRDLLGRVYEYFLGRFASLEGRGGEDYTPQSVVNTLVEMLEPYEGTVLDPCCGTGGMFVQSQEFVMAHGGSTGALRVFGQECNPTTWRLARMNLLMHGIRGDLGHTAADALHETNHSGLLADRIIANPPFNVSDWRGESLRDPQHWEFGVPPVGNANYAWVQHFVRHLAPGGTAGFVLANGALDSKQTDELAIRRRLIEADLVDSIVALPTKMFTNTSIPASLWFLSKNRTGSRTSRPRTGEVLFIDARRLGRLETRRQRVFDEQDIDKVASAYKRWHKKSPCEPHEDIPGFCSVAHTRAITDKNYTLVPSRYIPPAVEVQEWTPERLEDVRRDVGRLLSESATAGDELLRVLGRIR